MEYVTVRGTEVPALGFGTARMDTDDERRRAVSAALETGYRHIDTAQVYGSEGAVGDAIEASDVDREELFVTTKLSGENRARDAVLDSTRESLDRLGTDYVDLLLIHSPDQDVPIAETIRAMNELRDDELVRHVGVSNFSVDRLDRAMESSDAPILTNQVEYNPYHGQSSLLRFCIDEGVMLTAYSPLGVGDVLGDETLAEIGDAHGKTAAQVAVRWLLQQPMVSTIPMSSDPEHIRSNFDVFDFDLSDDEMRRVFDLGAGLDDDLAAALGL
jgi:diketogulonate reductase-like aldo/keto reductase